MGGVGANLATIGKELKGIQSEAGLRERQTTSRMFMLPTRKHFLFHNGPQACRESKYQLKQASRDAQGDDLENDSIWHVGFHSHAMSSFICSYYDVRQHWKLHKRHSSKFLKQFA